MIFTNRKIGAQEMLDRGINKYIFISNYIIMMVLVFAVSFTIGATVKAKKAKLTCKSFDTYDIQKFSSSWSAANDAYIHGAKQLDGDGDQIPCEALLPVHSIK